MGAKQVQKRRKLDFQSLDELLADAERVAHGPVTQLGNWSPGQIFRHLATAFVGSIDGFTATFPWHMRFVSKLFKKQLLKMSMPAGIGIPADAVNVLLPDPTDTEAGLRELKAAIDRLRSETKRAPNPVFGEMTIDEWNQLHLKHASLHMSFLVPGE